MSIFGAARAPGKTGHRSARCVHCRDRLDAYHFYPDVSILYPRASEAAGRSVFAHLRCTSVMSFLRTDDLLVSWFIAHGSRAA